MSYTKYAYGTKYRDVLNYTGTKRYIAFGQGGNDYISGSNNNDKLYGGDGNDYLVGNGGKDYFNGGSGTDTVSYSYYTGNVTADLIKDVASFSTSPYTETLRSIENLTGGSGNDWLRGDNGTNSLSGGSGDDYLFGRNGNDNLYGGSGDDFLSGGNNDDLLVGHSGKDYFNGGSGTDTVSFYDHTGNITADLKKDAASFSNLSYTEILRNIENLNGGSGNDTLKGDDGKNTLRGGAGNDWLYGENGNDTIWGDSGNDYLFGGWGNDVIYGGFGNDVVYGNEGNDYLYGEQNDDIILGWKGNDKLVGGSGNDRLDGSSPFEINASRRSEYDSLTGGDGADVFILGWRNSSVQQSYYQGIGYATITDFDHYEGDKIQIFGSSSDYTLTHGNWEGGSALDTIIRRNGDTIGVVQDTTNVSFSRDFTSV